MASGKRAPQHHERDRLTKREREAIEEQYLRTGKPKKRLITKPTDKFRFDWQNTEDTSGDIDPLYQEAQLLFGRGFHGGVDREVQKQRIDRHWTEKKLEEMTERDWRIFSEDFNISYKGGSRAPNPIRNWAESKLSPELLKAVDRSRFDSPSPIQMAAIPLGLNHRDLIGIAETGSGKTAAFVLPLLAYISKSRPPSAVDEGPFAVVLAPTRELVQQIETQISKLAASMDRIKVVSIVGGQSIEEQGIKIGQGSDVVVATPGRLIDCLERRYIVLNKCNYVVLDEADRMIDMGFERQVVSVLDSMPESNYRTTFMFSATMPPSVERLAKKYLKNHVVVTVGKVNHSITQHVVFVKESEKLRELRRVLDRLRGKTTSIVFVNTRKKADFVANSLEKSGFLVTAFRGGKSQDQRETSLEGFRSGRYDVLVATDVAARGIDVPDVAHVVNYDMSGTIETYMHRIGRTGQAGKKGEATTFLTVSDSGVFYDLKETLVRSKCRVPPELARHEASKFKPRSMS